jgi:hypothetical protein
MLRSLQLAAGLGVAWAMTLSVTLRADEAKELKVIASASDPNPDLVRLKKEDSGVVLRSPEDLVAHSSKARSAKDPDVQKEMEAKLAKRLKVKSIDWGKQMVLVVQGHATAGEMGSIKFGSPKSEDKALKVPWKQENRVSLVSYKGPPTGFALVDRTEGDVTFVAAPKK